VSVPNTEYIRLCVVYAWVTPAIDVYRPEKTNARNRKDTEKPQNEKPKEKQLDLKSSGKTHSPRENMTKKKQKLLQLVEILVPFILVLIIRRKTQPSI